MSSYGEEADFPKKKSLEGSSVNITTVETKQLRQLLLEYKNVFSRSSQDLGRTDRVVHKIETKNAPPIRTQSRRLPIGEKENRVVGN